MTMNFTDKVAIVTGAGRGVGQQEAMLLGRLGAKVVVNDWGAGIRGENPSNQAAETVAESIRSVGGVAIPDTSNVATDEGARTVVAKALAHFGKLDILVCNAGTIQHGKHPKEVSWDMMSRQFDLMVTSNAISVAAAWDALSASGQGRIVLTASSGVLGIAGSGPYCSAKAGVIGLTRSLALDGKTCGIKVNSICPLAYTRLVDGFSDDAAFNRWFEAHARADYVAPMTGYLAHADCAVTGRTFIAGIGHVSELFLGTTAGWTKPGMSIEDISANLSSIMEHTNYAVPNDSIEFLFSVIENVKGRLREYIKNQKQQA